jgi:two-component system, NarL family, sensor histidine kinase DesK
MRRLAMLTAVATIAPLCILGVALTANSWLEGLIISACFLLTLGALREWSLDEYPRHSILALGVTGASWAVGAFTVASPLGFVPLSVACALMLARSRRRTLWVFVSALSAAGMGATVFVLHPITPELAAAYVATPLAGTFFVAGMILVSEQAWLVARRLELAKDTEAQFAVARERIRFAGDLHDIQGHSLHVIKFKAELAHSLVRDAPERAEEELNEIRRLARETIAETRSLTYARHELNLPTEIENARRLCEAAGIAVDACIDHHPGAVAHPLLAQVLREATTNLLRHARPTTVRIEASTTAVAVTNDGVLPSSSAPLRGLARLRERIEAASGTLHIVRETNRFEVLAQLAPGRDGKAGQ